jgi:hypothetical protein
MIGLIPWNDDTVTSKWSHSGGFGLLYRLHQGFWLRHGRNKEKTPIGSFVFHSITCRYAMRGPLRGEAKGFKTGVSFIEKGSPLVR